jgi:hypothetical protein
MASTELRVTSAQLDRLAEWLRRTGSPQTIQELAYQYIVILREEALGIEEGE